MRGQLFIKLGLVFSTIGWSVYSYLDEMNSLTYCRMRVPELIDQSQAMEEDVLEMEYQLRTLKSYKNIVRFLESFPSQFYIPTSEQIFTIDRSCLETSNPSETVTTG
ncbi:MAG: hypothetical protein ACOYK9_01485 [Chlamydiia bacterium]